MRLRCSTPAAVDQNINQWEKLPACLVSLTCFFSIAGPRLNSLSGNSFSHALDQRAGYGIKKGSPKWGQTLNIGWPSLPSIYSSNSLVWGYPPWKTESLHCNSPHSETCGRHIKGVADSFAIDKVKNASSQWCALDSVPHSSIRLV